MPQPLRKVTRAYSNHVSYIPDQDDPLGVAVTEAVRHGPYYLAIRDVVTCARMFTLFPGVITPVFTTNPQHEFYLWGSNLFGLALLSFASIFEVILILTVVPLFLILPGPIAVIMFICGQMTIHVICFPMQGPSKIWSKSPSDPAILAQHERNAGERWFFLNGCCVSGHNVQQNVDVLSETFGRPVFGIHNRTYGVLGDLFECIMQRAFDYFTEETRVCYEYIKAYCADPTVKKVVIIAHSQGCIMASQILDQLYVDMPADAVAKIEVYTFGNAASHFNNPLRKISPTGASLDTRDMPSETNGHSDIISSPDNRASHMRSLDGSSASRKAPAVSEMLPERVIPHIEHYCNSGDMVTRWGALFSAKSILSNRFCGHIFINEGASGHMLNQHYLTDMFPRQHERPGTGTGDNTYSESVNEGVPFLDRIVDLDTATVTQRHVNAVHQLAVMRHDSTPEEHEDHDHLAHASQVSELKVHKSKSDFEDLTLGEGTKLSKADLSGAEGSRISVVKAHDPYEKSKGKTVRQLSRLWRYMDGGDPDVPGSAVQWKGTQGRATANSGSAFQRVFANRQYG